MTTEELNALRTRLHNFGVGHWIDHGNTDKRAQMMQVSEACVAALDQFDKFGAEIARLQEFINSEFFQRVTYKQENDALRERNAWLSNYVKACDNERDRAMARLMEVEAGMDATVEKLRERLKQKALWEQAPPHCSTCSCEPLPAQFLKPADDVPDARCGACGEPHVEGAYYNHNFVSRAADVPAPADERRCGDCGEHESRCVCDGYEGFGPTDTSGAEHG